MKPVTDRPFLPQVFPENFPGITRTMGEFVKVLLSLFSEYGFRLNATLPKDGTEPMGAPLTLLTIEASDLSNYPAADWPGALIYVSNASAGEKFKGSDGTNWVNLG